MEKSCGGRQHSSLSSQTSPRLPRYDGEQPPTQEEIMEAVGPSFNFGVEGLESSRLWRGLACALKVGFSFGAASLAFRGFRGLSGSASSGDVGFQACKGGGEVGMLILWQMGRNGRSEALVATATGCSFQKSRV